MTLNSFFDFNFPIALSSRIWCALLNRHARWRGVLSICGSSFCGDVVKWYARFRLFVRIHIMSDFEAEFQLTFCLENEATTSLMCLESERYFQGQWTIDMYVDEFSNLINLSGYSDPLAIVIKFCQGLNASTQDQIAESGTDRPADNDPDGWYRAAHCFNSNRLANEVFHTSLTKRSVPAHQAPDGQT
jgi:hypothetical protein